jgi:hypothetical protein
MGKNKKNKKPTQTISLAEFTGPRECDEQLMPTESLSQLGIVPVTREPTERMSRAEQDAHWRTPGPEEPEVDWSMRGTEITGPTSDSDKDIDWSIRGETVGPIDKPNEVDWSTREAPIAPPPKAKEVDWSTREAPTGPPAKPKEVDWSTREATTAPPAKKGPSVSSNWREDARPVKKNSKNSKNSKSKYVPKKVAPNGNWRKTSSSSVCC